MTEETEKKLLNLLEKIESHLAKMATKSANSAVAEIPVGDHVEADVKIETSAREWKNAGGWFYDAEIEFNGGKSKVSLAVNKKAYGEQFNAGDVIFARLEKGKPNKRGEPTFWFSSLISKKGQAKPTEDAFGKPLPQQQATWQIGSTEPPPF